jgi:hypothetical protein
LLYLKLKSFLGNGFWFELIIYGGLGCLSIFVGKVAVLLRVVCGFVEITLEFEVV